MKKINLKPIPFKPLDALLCIDNLHFCIHECMLSRDNEDEDKFNHYFDQFNETLSDLIHLCLEVDGIEEVKETNKKYS